MPILARARRLLHPALLALLLPPALLQAAPEERWYQVEIILFSQNNPEYRESELWPADYTLPELAQSRELFTPATVSPLPQPFTRLAVEQLQLGQVAQRIDSATDVELQLHLGWLQPGLAAEQAVAVHIYEGMTEEPKVGEAKGDAVDEQLPRFDGTLRLILSRYLHLESDLLWREPLATQPFAISEEPLAPSAENSDTAQDGQPPAMADDITTPPSEEMTGEEMTSQEAAPNYQLFRQQQSRLMRSGEVHYIDHPLFGIIVQVTPYQLPETQKPVAAVPSS
ncbi:MAG: peptidoglycan binding protein CsiV [Gammaproteobacteria bacterium]|nr:peptidoglycan binding protein CsiV [Gammaproteobacteria bacterium]